MCEKPGFATHNASGDYAASKVGECFIIIF